MTMKRKINTILKATGLPVGYRMSDERSYHVLAFSLLYNGAERLSNERHNKRMIYQIDYFCLNSVEIETFPLFDEINQGIGSTKLNRCRLARKLIL